MTLSNYPRLAMHAAYMYMYRYNAVWMLYSEWWIPLSPVITRSNLHPTSIIHLPHIHQLPASSSGDLIRQSLAHQSFIGGLDSVHRGSRSGYSGREVVDTCCAGDFVDVMLTAETESLTHNQWRVGSMK